VNTAFVDISNTGWSVQVSVPFVDFRLDGLWFLDGTVDETGKVAGVRWVRSVPPSEEARP
jgi:hypothetical protein